MIGGEFISHGAQQVAKLDVVDPDFPGAKGVRPESFEINDEWYAQKNLPTTCTSSSPRTPRA